MIFAGLINFALTLLIVGGIIRFVESKIPDTKLGAALAFIY